MATNLRLRPETEAALRDEASRRGMSQQAVIREALDRHLGLTEASVAEARLVAQVAVVAPRLPYRSATELIELPSGVTSADLLDHSERF